MLPPMMPKPLKSRIRQFAPVPARATPTSATEGKPAKSALRVLGGAQRVRPLAMAPRVLIAKGAP